MRRLERVLLVAAAVPFGVAVLVGSGAAEPQPADVVLSFADDRILESSGLVARDGLVVTVNDSGDSNRIFAVDPSTGETVGVTAWQGEAEDIEALAPAARGEVYVGDIGDNAKARDAIELARVPYGRRDREVEAPTYELVYADGPHDAETLLVHPGTGRVYVVAKEFVGRLYAAPERLGEDGPNRLEPVDDVLGTATDGAFLPDGRHLVLRNYTQAAFYTWPDLERVAMVALPDQQQGEGIAVTSRGEVLLSSEGAHSEVLRLALPDALRAQLAGTRAEPDAAAKEPRPEPAREPTTVEEGRSWWPWGLGAVAGLVIVAVLLRSLRPR